MSHGTTVPQGKFNVGDRIVALIDYPGGTISICMGDLATVKSTYYSSATVSPGFEYSLDNDTRLFWGVDSQFDHAPWSLILPGSATIVPISQTTPPMGWWGASTGSGTSTHEPIKNECECGAYKANGVGEGPAHSSWCPQWRKYE